MGYRPLPCVLAFIEAFERLSPEDRERANGELAGFLMGYCDGKDEAFKDAEGEPQVLSEVSGETLAETMNALNIRHGAKNRGQA
jgi:hypothetical protein